MFRGAAETEGGTPPGRVKRAWVFARAPFTFTGNLVLGVMTIPLVLLSLAGNLLLWLIRTLSKEKETPRFEAGLVRYAFQLADTLSIKRLGCFLAFFGAERQCEPVPP